MNRKVSVAPMMDCTDRHERFFLRLISKNVLFYTEMIVSEAISRGDKKKLLSFNLNEKPLALQVGGSSPALLAEAAKTGEDFGYDEINLNLGCPSKKVQKNMFGACLMKEPNLVFECINEMVNSCSAGARRGLKRGNWTVLPASSSMPMTTSTSRTPATTGSRNSPRMALSWPPGVGWAAARANWTRHGASPPILKGTSTCPTT